MESLQEIKGRIESAVPGASVQILPNAAVPSQSSLVVDATHAPAVARFLRDDPRLRFDFCSNVTGVDWLDAVTKQKARTQRMLDGVATEVEESVEHRRPGFLEVVYHLYSIALRHGPLVLRQRTDNRTERCALTSLTPVWRGAEFQEREIYDLFGIRLDGHPDLRRLLMWDEFADYPMRKDYAEPDDYEYEPTPHAGVLDKARRHFPAKSVR
jgi:NADH-quinone oxidoreductase subunit C